MPTRDELRDQLTTLGATWEPSDRKPDLERKVAEATAAYHEQVEHSFTSEPLSHHEAARYDPKGGSYPRVDR